MVYVFVIAFFVCAYSVAAGLVRPSLAIGPRVFKKSRVRILFVYCFAAFISFVMIGFRLPPVADEIRATDRNLLPTDGKDSETDTTHNGSSELEYEVLNEEVYDAPVKAQVVLSILVKGHVTEDNLRSLLNKRFFSIMKRPFKYHNEATNVNIHVFASRRYYDSYLSGAGAPWASLSKSYGDKESTIHVDMDEYERQMTLLNSEPIERFGLSEDKRIQVWLELISVDRLARKEAEQSVPVPGFGQSLSTGNVFQLTEETPLMPELDPFDPLEAVSRMRYLPKGTSIRILEVSIKNSTPWYFVKSRSRSGGMLGSGWINSSALIQQGQVMKQLEKQGELEVSLRGKYEDDIANKYGIDRDQLRSISVEGIEKYWPFPPDSE